MVTVSKNSGVAQLGFSDSTSHKAAIKGLAGLYPLKAPWEEHLPPYSLLVAVGGLSSLVAVGWSVKQAFPGVSSQHGS